MIFPLRGGHGTSRQNITPRRGRLHSEKFRNHYFSPNITMVTKRGLEMIGIYDTNFEKKIYLRDIGVDVSIIDHMKIMKYFAVTISIRNVIL
jgi:hypothetical protein